MAKQKPKKKKTATPKTKKTSTKKTCVREKVCGEANRVYPMTVNFETKEPWYNKVLKFCGLQ